MLIKTAIIAISLALLMAAVGCAGPPEIREVEVTREVPVTVETVKNVEVTREVPVTQEVPVTVVVSKTVEVTREVTVSRTDEVTREVPVTRVEVITPTPAAPAAAPTVTPADAPTATPSPTLTPTAAPTPTPMPTPPEASQFHPWTMERSQYPNQYGNLENKFLFQLEALEYEIGDQAPTLTYECDHSGRRTMYINWYHPITAMSSERPSSSRDPFSQYRDIPYYALLEYADGLLPFVDELRLSLGEQDDLDEIWDEVRKRWFAGTGASHLASDTTPQMLVDLLRDRTHRSVGIRLGFYVETIDPDEWSKYGLPPLDSIGGEWIVLSDRTQINPGSLGELRRAVRETFSQPFEVGTKRAVMTATITRPGQPALMVAKWDITGIRQVLSHCQAIRL